MVYDIIMLFIWFLLLSYIARTSTSLETLAVGESIKDGETLVSAGGTIELGFFIPENSTLRYLGVSIRNVTPSTVIWVANRDKPLQHNSGVLKLNENGILLLLNETNRTVWSSAVPSIAVKNPIAHPLDTGNFVVKNGQETDKERFLWQSFDYPCDTLIPGLKLGWNLETGREKFLTSWKSDNDPAEGEYTLKVDLRGYPQVIKFKGPDNDIVTRTGSWNGRSLAWYPGPVPQVSWTFVFNEKEVYFELQLLDRSVFGAYTLTPSGRGQSFLWTNQSGSRQVFSIGEEDQCERFAFCGVNSFCSIVGNNQATCDCLKGYVSKFPEQWNLGFYENGCVRRNETNCTNSYKDGFLKYKNMKLPDTSLSWYSRTINLRECRQTCLRNCSCVAYADLDIRNGGSGCLLWFNNLVDVRKFSQWGQNLYIRVPPSELAVGQGNIKKIIGITIGGIAFGLIIFVSILTIKKPGAARKIYSKLCKNKPRIENVDLPTLEFSILAIATENFSNRNKLGEGGFGPVYKGTMMDGQEIAVKRLSKKSGQGLTEFKNEVALIAKLQHRNLVRLLGCCIQGEEKLLIYEYMPNKSLDYFVFDETKRMSLGWPNRSNIIMGIARGLLYLHQDSRLRIIHRDLKTSNILLDSNLDPKISDFGLARAFLGDQVEANTNRVAGTYGYMPPEYAERGHFSVKSDVFSFGVIVLEIVSGKKNSEFADPEHYHSLLGYAWRLWTEEKELKLLDEMLGERCTPFEVIRCIQVGLLCVQQRPEQRPDMLSVVLMLNGEKLLPKPKVPGFYIGTDITLESDSSFSIEKL